MQTLVPFILAQTDPEGGNALVSFLPLILIGVVFYFLLIRPQQKRAKQQRELVDSVSVGDLIVTIGGIHGTVELIDEETLRLEVAPGTTITMIRSAIARRIVDADEPAVDSPDLATPDDA